MAALAAASVAARAAGPSDPPPQVPVGLLDLMARAGEIRMFQASVQRMLERFAREGEAVLESDLALAEARARAKAHAARLGEVMRHDLDGDGAVTRAEVEARIPQPAEPDFPRPKTATTDLAIEDSREWSRWAADQVSMHNGRLRIMLADLDRNGTITFDEARQAPPGFSATPRIDPELIAARALFQRDPNGDGRLTFAEADAMAAQDFAAFDTDGNGVIDPMESARLEQARTAARESSP